MQEITLTFLPKVQPHEFEHAVEEFAWQASDRRFKVKVRHQGEDEVGYNVYTIMSDTPQGFYFAGIVVSKLIDQLEGKK